MKRAFACIIGAAVFASAAATAGTLPTSAASAKKATPDPCASKPSKWQRTQCEQYVRSAPGDEYFGRLKMSYLGINNTFHDEAIRAGAYTTDPGIIAKVGFADEALNAWMRKYPGDPQLARTFFLASQMYKRIYTRPAQDKAWKYMQLLAAQFPTTYFGKLVKKEIAIGFTEHYFANALPCPTPLPSGVQPENTPSATASPSPAPGQPKVDIIVPPCVPPATPTPAPTPTELPSLSPLPAASGLPAPSALPSPTPAASGVPIPVEVETPSPQPAPALTPAPTPTP